jgi:hypothetical protein
LAGVVEVALWRPQPLLLESCPGYKEEEERKKRQEEEGRALQQKSLEELEVASF